MKKTIVLSAFALLAVAGFAQKKTTTSASVNFDATTAIDELPKAENKTGVAAIDLAKGTVAFEVAIKNFSFSNPMIQEHFNGEKWMNSDKFPASTFKGKITNPEKVNFNADGTYTANVEGDLTIRGVTKPVKTTVDIKVNGKSIATTTAFSIKLSDYEITGSPITAGKVANETKITVSAEF